MKLCKALFDEIKKNKPNTLHACVCIITCGRRRVGIRGDVVGGW